jgi:hypothetical protein
LPGRGIKRISWGVLCEGDAGETGGVPGAVGNAKKRKCGAFRCVLVQRMRRARAEPSAGGEEREAILTAIFNKLERDDSEPIGMKRA